MPALKRPAAADLADRARPRDLLYERARSSLGAYLARERAWDKEVTTMTVTTP